jgi:hypothetical protein
VVVVALGLGVSTMFAGPSEAKPNQCILAIEPFYVCQPSASCKEPGEQKCWICLGRDVYGEPCLCSRVGCMVPPQ